VAEKLTWVFPASSRVGPIKIAPTCEKRRANCCGHLWLWVTQRPGTEESRCRKCGTRNPRVWVTRDRVAFIQARARDEEIREGKINAGL